MSENLFSKYRPKILDGIFGHDIIVKGLKKRFKENSIPHAIFLSGISGTGKTTLIRIIAKSILCQNKDENGNGCNECEICKTIDQEKLSNIYFEYNASNLGIDNMREIEDSASKRIIGQYNIKIFVIDEMQELSKSKSAEKNLLKVLEKPTDHVYFILGTMDASKVSTAVKNRCVPYKLNLLSYQDIAKCLQDICSKEGIEIDGDKAKALITIAQNANGSLRTAISYLERCLDSDIWDSKSLLKELEIISDSEVITILDFIFQGDVKALNYTLNEEVLKKLRFLLMLYYKRLNKVELNRWQLSQIKDLPNYGIVKSDIIMKRLNELSLYPYVYEELIEYYILQIINDIKNAK